MLFNQNKLDDILFFLKIGLTNRSVLYVSHHQSRGGNAESRFWEPSIHLTSMLIIKKIFSAVKYSNYIICETVICFIFYRICGLKIVRLRHVFLFGSFHNFSARVYHNFSIGIFVLLFIFILLFMLVCVL